MKKIVFILVLCLLLLAFSIPVYASNSDEVIVLKKAENRYLIYFNEISNNVFQFAISDKSEVTTDDLVFVNSAKDGISENSLNVAFIDETNFNPDAEDIYIWVKDVDNNLIVSREKLDLKDVIDDEIINLINTTTIANDETDRIKVDTTQTQSNNEMINGVDTTITTGKIVIDTHNNSSYYYELYSANDNTSNFGKLFDVADKINNYSGDSLGKLKLAKEFYNLYLTLMPKASEWKNVENSTILQPEDSRTGDKYVVYIKEVKEDESEIVDVKLLECFREESQGKNEKENEIQKEVTQTVKLPITYDSIALIVLFVIIFAAIIIVSILKIANTNKKAKHF